MKYKSTVLVTGVGGAACAFLIRHLQKNGFFVIGIDANASANGLILANKSYIVPLANDPEYLKIIENICYKDNVNFIIPLIDEEIITLKKIESNKIKIICPSIDFSEKVIDKYNLISELSDLKLSHPKTSFLESYLSFNAFPAVIKPISGRGSRDVYYVNDHIEIEQLISDQKLNVKNFIIQEKIIGDEYTVSVVVSPDNILISVVPKKIIEKKGITQSAVTVFNKRIYDVCCLLTKKLKPCNPFNAQLILQKDTNIPFIFEINPRFSTTVTLTIHAGVDEVLLPINYYLDSNPSTIPANFTEGCVLIRETKDNYLSFEQYQEKMLQIEDFYAESITS